MGSNGNFRMSGSVYHCIGTLIPVANQPPKFARLYLIDSEVELQNCMKVFDKDGKKDDRGMRAYPRSAAEHVAWLQPLCAQVQRSCSFRTHKMAC